jgi:hypothetical protein
VGDDEHPALFLQSSDARAIRPAGILKTCSGRSATFRQGAFRKKILPLTYNMTEFGSMS